jgi:hypothetical protein
MTNVPQQSGGKVNGATASQALLGVVLLLLAAYSLGMRVDGGPEDTRAAYVAAGALLCGITALASSWFVYCCRPHATTIYAASWSFNIMGWMTLGLASHYRPLWWVLATTGCLVVAAIRFTSTVHRALEKRQLES